MIKFVFFDRDDTLLYMDETLRDRTLSEISKILGIDYSHLFRTFAVWYIDTNDQIKRQWKNINTKQKENQFWRDSFEDLYIRLFSEKSCLLSKKEAVSLFYSKLLYYKLYSVYDDVMNTLDALKREGYTMGVISDTLPMLKESLDHFNLSRYFDTFTAAADVGYLKPSGIIFHKALTSLNAVPDCSIYIDDRPEKLEGLDKLRIYGILIDRYNNHPNAENRVSSLFEIPALIGNLK